MQKIFMEKNRRNSQRHASITNKYLKMALRAVEGHDYDENLKSFHAAVIVRGGKVLSVGVNKFKTHTMAVIPRISELANYRGLDYIQSIHAEMDAINKVSNKDSLKNAKIFVARLDRLGEPAMSCPCPLCQYHIKKHGIKKMIYTTGFGPHLENIS